MRIHVHAVALHTISVIPNAGELYVPMYFLTKDLKVPQQGDGASDPRGCGEEVLAGDALAVVVWLSAMSRICAWALTFLMTFRK